MRYGDARAFRAALEDRLRRLARETGRPLDRLRKQAVSERLLARLVEVAPADAWALKGGLALIARLGDDARGTRDADATWRAAPDQLVETIEDIVEFDPQDWFTFQIGSPRTLTAEGPEGGLRYPVLAVVDGREFERLSLDVNRVPGDSRRIEPLVLRSLFAFAGLDPVVVPAIPVAQQLAEKLHAYTRDYGQVSSRAKDLYDMLVLASRVAVPPADPLAHSCRETFELRATPWPPELQPPPDQWTGFWKGHPVAHAPRWGTLADAYVALEAFWRPVLEQTSAHLHWDATGWCWEPSEA